MNRKSLVGFLCLVAFPLTATNAAVTFYSNVDAFRSAAQQAGKRLKGTLDYENGVIGVGQILGISDPLGPNTANPPVWPNGLGPDPGNVTIQANTGGADSTVPRPHGANGLAAANTVLGYNTKWVVANYFVDALDTILGEPNHTAVGGNLISVGSSGPVRMRVYDKNNQLLGEQTFNVTPGAFGGVVSDDTLGRINLYSTSNQAEGWDNVQLWVPEPASLSLLGLGALALRRRR